MGLGIFWKPVGVGSQEYLGTLKGQLGLPGAPRQDIGHNGTLDPFAEGILCVGFFEATKLLAPLVGLDKVYEAELCFEATSESFDPTNDLQWHEVVNLPSEEAFVTFLKAQVGRFSQKAPLFSAKHIDGKRGYEWARAGVEKEVQSKDVEIKRVKFLRLSEKELAGRKVHSFAFEVEVSSGTYIRALARDWGQLLVGKPGILLSLKRTQMGPWTVKNATECPKWLGARDLQPLFEITELTRENAQILQEQGRLVDAPYFRNCPKPQLLVDPRGYAVAWLPANFENRLGRVFLKNPFERLN